MPAFTAYSQRAPGLIRSYWNCAKQLEGWAGQVKNITPYLVLAETGSLSRKLKVTGILTPIDPRSPHDGKNTLELHLKQGPPLFLSDALSPISGITGVISKWKWAKNLVRTVITVIDSAVRSILGAGVAPIRMLEPEEDFPHRQKVRFAGYKSVAALSIPYHGLDEKHRFPTESFAEPYGGGVTDMNWKSRLTEKPEKQ